MRFNPGFTYPAQRRLHRREEFVRALTGQPFTNSWFSVYAYNNTLGLSRLGIIASRRAIPGAVGRNYAKRLVREVFRTTVRILPAHDIVVRVRRPIAQESASEGRNALIKLFKSLQ